MENQLGILLENLRGKRSLREISKISGLSHTYIRYLELGLTRTSPSQETLQRLAEAYDYPYEDLVKKATYIKPQQVEKTQNVIDTNPIDLFNLLNGDSPVEFKGRLLSERRKKLIAQLLDAAINIDDRK